MKKGLFALLSICMLVALPACYKDKDGKPAKAKNGKNEMMKKDAKKASKKEHKSKADKKAGNMMEDKHHKKAKGAAMEKAPVAASKTYSSRY